MCPPRRCGYQGGVNPRRRLLGLAVFLLAVTGVVLLVASEATGVRAAGVMLLGLGLVIAVAAVFLEVGLSEERERRGEEPGRRPPPP